MVCGRQGGLLGVRMWTAGVGRGWSGHEGTSSGGVDGWKVEWDVRGDPAPQPPQPHHQPPDTSQSLPQTSQNRSSSTSPSPVRPRFPCPPFTIILASRPPVLLSPVSDRTLKQTGFSWKRGRPSRRGSENGLLGPHNGVTRLHRLPRTCPQNSTSPLSCQRKS